MPPRNNPTARQARLGAELRKMRERAGMTAREAAIRISSNHVMLSHQEAGRSGTSEDRIRRLAGVYSCDDDALIDALAAMANERGKGWWEESRGILAQSLLDLTELEHHATFVRTYQVVHIPGLFQTEEYMRAVFNLSASQLSAADRDAQIEHRLRRQRIIEPEVRVPHLAIIHEAALHMRFGGRKVARAQLDRVLELSHRENVTVRVVAYDAEGFMGAGNPLMYVGGPVPQLDTVQLDAVHDILLLDAEAQLAKYRNLLDRMEKMSLTAEGARDFIHRMAQQT
ncbi:helix-turn-helix domain-containing protein [Actinacidiphila oryziradicis]|uniref:Helix-turn-helix domain-containing protein n=1 Tax=Actinacidiphila oryziradicis TaxID=2571141 RepID=A0A4U0SRS5_9ACTN|nr:helix-turn-helix transcriptional regulator [Actinacidiphila oryziradicis]TKA12656.1 helix-turn-helix domain-containing protein [Actinacidiphila oryziradicis]